MKKIIIELKNISYPVIIGSGIFKNISEYITIAKNFEKILFVVDKNVWKIYRDKITALYPDKSNSLYYYKFTAIEENKSFNELQKIHSFMIKNNFGKDSLLIAAGGGITGDVAGFAASTYMRGIKFINIPTTLLASVDSSIGGKTAINYLNVKNVIGSLYQPEAVVIDTDFLYSLPKEEIVSGLGEVIKYTYLTNIDFYKFVAKNLDGILNLDIKIINEVIYQCILFKGSVVEKDANENELRKILNFGHTFAHAVESVSNFSIKHGEAVIFGIVAAINLSFKIGLFDASKYNSLIKLLSGFHLNKKIIALDNNKMFNFMKSDKKNRKGKNKFILINDIGKILIGVEASKKDVIYSLNKAKQFFN